MSVVMIITALPLGTVHAGMVSTKTIIEQEKPAAAALSGEQAPRERIRDLLVRDDVRAEMIALGIAPAEAEARIAALTDQEIAEIAGRLDQLPAGEGIGLGTVLVILFIVFGMAVIMDALGMMDIFPFVCSGDQCRAGAAQAYYPEPAAGPTPIYPYEGDRSTYPRDNFNNPYSQRSPQGYRNNQYYQPQPLPQGRNYYEERFGTQRYVR